MCAHILIPQCVHTHRITYDDRGVLYALSAKPLYAQSQSNRQTGMKCAAVKALALLQSSHPHCKHIRSADGAANACNIAEISQPASQAGRQEEQETKVDFIVCVYARLLSMWS